MEDSLPHSLYSELFQDDTFELGAILALKKPKASKFALGSRIGRAPNLRRDFSLAHNQIMADYFDGQPVYGADIFERRFRMTRDMFLKIASEMSSYDQKIKQQKDATGKPGLSTIQKCTAAMRMLAYGCPADSVDEYVKIGESTCNIYLERFCSKISQLYGNAYPGDPGSTQNEKVLLYNANRGLPGLHSCLDNYCWSWDNCPTA